MPLTGPFAKIALWERKIQTIGSDRVRFEIADEMADIALGLVAEEFSQERDPFGNPWAPPKQPTGRLILRGKTNKLVTWRKASVNQHGFRIDSRAPYAKFHQRGTRNRDGSQRMVARRMIPDGTRLPAPWASELRGAFIRRMHALLK